MYPHISQLEYLVDQTCSFIGKVQKINGAFTEFETPSGNLRVKHTLLNTQIHHNVFIEGIVQKDEKGCFLKEQFSVLMTDFDIKTFEKVRIKL